MADENLESTFSDPALMSTVSPLFVIPDVCVSLIFKLSEMNVFCLLNAQAYNAVSWL